MKYTPILCAHREAKKVVMFWGSSGWGKTASVKAYCQDKGLGLVIRNAVYLDPLNSWLPRENTTLQVIEDIPHAWVKDILTASAPLVLFLDELTRCRSVQIMNMLTELVLERTFNGHPISEHVQIICATNLYDEDNGLVEVPDAVMNRMTHIVFAPEASEAAAHMRTELGRQVLLQQPSVLRVPGIPELPLDGNPRQIDDIVDLWNTGLLSKDDLKLVCCGRVGKEKGAVVAATILDIVNKTELALPPALTYKDFPRIAKAEAAGMGIEVVNLLRASIEMDKSKGQLKSHLMVSDYLIQYATPETCRAMQTAKFYYQYPQGVMPKEADDTDIENKYDNRTLKHGMPVQYYLIAKRKLVDKAPEVK
jgi:hypothetical protein